MLKMSAMLVSKALLLTWDGLLRVVKPGFVVTGSSVSACCSAGWGSARVVARRPFGGRCGQQGADILVRVSRTVLEE